MIPSSLKLFILFGSGQDDMDSIRATICCMAIIRSILNEITGGGGGGGGDGGW